MSTTLEIPGIPPEFFRRFLPSRDMGKVDEEFLLKVFYALDDKNAPPVAKPRAIDLHKLAKAPYYMAQPPVVGCLMQLYAAKTFDFYIEQVCSNPAHVDQFRGAPDLALVHGKDISWAAFAYSRAAKRAGDMNARGLEVRCLHNSINLNATLVRLGKAFDFAAQDPFRFPFIKHQDLLPGDINFSVSVLTGRYDEFSAEGLGYTLQKTKPAEVLEQQNAN